MREATNQEFYLKPKMQDPFIYRNFSAEPLGSFDKTFCNVNIEHHGQSVRNAVIRISSNFLVLEKERIKFNLVNLYLRARDARTVDLAQEGFRMTLEFAAESDLVAFKSSCDNFVVRENVWGSYFEMRQLDKGAFSTVRLARRCNGYSELFAVKEMRKDKVDEKAFRYLEMELFALRNLRNEHALKLFEIFEDDSNIYLVTEYLNGGTLENRIKSKDITEETIKEVLGAVLGVIIELNKYSVVHRDIKPANIMFTFNRNNQESCKLIDFGLCADVTDHSASSLLRDKSGTVCYLAPELIGWDMLNKMYNEHVDIFSLGMILFEM